MKVRYYDAAFAAPNIASELQAMFDSGGQTEWEAASRFIEALSQMQADQQVYAINAAAEVRRHFGKEPSQVFGGNVQCRYRHALGHRLYLTFMPRAALVLRRAELRALTIHPEPPKVFDALDTVVARHSALNP